MKIFKIGMIGLVSFFALGCNLGYLLSQNDRPLHPKYIAHAAGGINGQTYTNSLEALNLNYRQGGRLFEVDFDLTRDGVVVAIHGWEAADDFIGGTEHKQYSHHAFKTFKRRDGFTQMDIDRVAKWLAAHPDAYIIPDVKTEGKNIEVLKKILTKYPQLSRQIIAQIYNFNEYEPVRELGFEHIILTGYRMKDKDEAIVNFAKNAQLYAIVLPQWRFKTNSLSNQLKSLGFFLYTHTINDCKKVAELNKKGVDGFITDFLLQKKCPGDS
jgi:glycerophosphoryl diester phosphodiesterase